MRDAENDQDHPSSVHVYKEKNIHTISITDLCSFGCNCNCTSDCSSYHMAFTFSEHYLLTHSHLYNWYTERTLPYNYGFHSTSYNALMYAANVMHSIESIFTQFICTASLQSVVQMQMVAVICQDWIFPEHFNHLCDHFVTMLPVQITWCMSFCVFTCKTSWTILLILLEWCLTIYIHFCCSLIFLIVFS